MRPSVFITLIAMAPYFGVENPLGIAPHVRMYAEFFLGTPVVLWGGWPSFRKFVLSLKNRSPNMYTLIGLGVALAYGFSLFAVFAPGLFPPEFQEQGGQAGAYFEAAVVIVTLVLLGEALQLRAMGQTIRAIRDLLAHVPPGKRGQTIWTFNRAGEFDFVCLIAGHYSTGMTGKVMVNDGKAAARGKS